MKAKRGGQGVERELFRLSILMDRECAEVVKPVQATFPSAAPTKVITPSYRHFSTEVKLTECFPRHEYTEVTTERCVTIR
jgi:hypothetical protein